MIKKDGKKKKSKLTEDQKREQIAAALKRKKECERKALDIVSREVFLSIKDILPDFRIREGADIRLIIALVPKVM